MTMTSISPILYTYTDVHIDIKLKEKPIYVQFVMPGQSEEPS